MGFNKRYLPEIDNLISIREKMNSDAEFLKIYLYNPDAIFGSQESMEFLKQVEQSQINKNDNERAHI